MKTYSVKELESFLHDLESDYIERKESFSDPDKVRQAVCAFANDLPDHRKPGVVFIGADDRDGKPSGHKITDELLRNLAAIRDDGKILPLPVLCIEKQYLNNGEMAVITVQPSDLPPVKYDGRIWIRTGPRRGLANEQEERILSEKRRSKNIPFDINPVPTAHIKDLSRVIFEQEYLPNAFASDVLEANGRTYEERLASCKMIVAPDEKIPTILGLLTLGNRTRDFIPGAYIQFLRINGTELGDTIIDAQEIDGPLNQMLRATEEKLQSHNRIGINITRQAIEERDVKYPLPALMQLVYNTVLHRTYEKTNAPIRIYWFNDRIEFHSPGGPYGNVTVDNFAKPGVTDYRNPNLAEVMKVYGMVQKFGYGIVTARRELEKNGNPPLNFEVSSGGVAAIVQEGKA